MCGCMDRVQCSNPSLDNCLTIGANSVSFHFTCITQCHATCPLYKLTTETCIHMYILRKPSVWSVGPLATVGSGPHCVLLNKSTGGKDWLVSHSVKLSRSQICRSQHAREVLGIKYLLEYVGMNYDRSLNCLCDL